MQKELKPCPFCGSNATYWYGVDSGKGTNTRVEPEHRIQCCSNKALCGVEMWAYSKEAVIKAWNTRALSQITIDEDKAVIWLISIDKSNLKALGKIGRGTFTESMYKQMIRKNLAQSLKKANLIKIEEKK